MSPQPLRDRIVAALRLQPMTTRDVTRSVSCAYTTSSRILHELLEEGSVRIAGQSPNGRHTGRPQRVWSAA